MAHTLYTDQLREWFFLVPDEAELLPGDADIYSVWGQRYWVDPEFILQFQVDPADVKAWRAGQIAAVMDELQAEASQQLETMLDRLQNGIVDWWQTEGKGQLGEQLYDWSARLNADAKATRIFLSSGGGARLRAVFAALTDQSPAAIEDDPEASKRGWQILNERMVALKSALQSGDEGQIRWASETINQMIDVFADHEIPVPRSLSNLGSILEEALTGDPEHIKQAMQDSATRFLTRFSMYLKRNMRTSLLAQTAEKRKPTSFSATEAGVSPSNQRDVVIRFAMPKPAQPVRDWVLVWKRGQSEPVARIPLAMDLFAIGRSSRNDVSLNSIKVASQHLTLKLTAEGYQVAVEPSGTGTLFNDQQASPGELHLLQDGDRVTIGDFTLEYRDTQASQG
ncbi:MAG: FHA domain-containing protein [Chloroflexi bacterium]|nr:FHA domain-containing protein [Chloroflexota bacterium]